MHGQDLRSKPPRGALSDLVEMAPRPPYTLRARHQIVFLTAPHALVEMSVGAILFIAVAVILGVVIAIAAMPKVQPVAENVSSSVDKIQDSVSKICKIDETIYDRVKNTFGNDPRVQQILELQELGHIRPECGLDQLYKYLGEENRKKISGFEMVCDVSHCARMFDSESRP